MRYIGIDEGEGDVGVEERYMKPTAEYPQGSYLKIVGGQVQMATGWYEKEYPCHPSLYWHKGPPFVLYEHIDVSWGTPVAFDGAVDRIIALTDKHLNALQPTKEKE